MPGAHETLIIEDYSLKFGLGWVFIIKQQFSVEVNVNVLNKLNPKFYVELLAKKSIVFFSI